MKNINKLIALIVTFAAIIVAFSFSINSKALEDGYPNSEPISFSGVSTTEYERSINVLNRDTWSYPLEVFRYKKNGTSTYYMVTYLPDSGWMANDDCTLSDAELSAMDMDNIDWNISTYNVSMRWVVPDPSPTSSPTSSPAPHEHSWQHGVIYPASEEMAGLEGDYCACGLTRNCSPIPAVACVIENRIQQIEWASPVKMTVLEMNVWNSLPNYFMKWIDSKKNCDFTMRFTYNKKHYELYIPAGTKFDNSLDWYGPEQLLAMFEYKELY